MDEKIKLKFKTTREKVKHRERELYFKDGDTHEVDFVTGQRLLKDFPNNFIDVTHPTPKPLLIPPTPELLSELKSTPLISILIPQRGRPAKLKKCLELILENTIYPNYEIILICDRDDIDSIATIPQDDRIKIVIDPSPTRRMFVGKINYGFTICKGDYIVYLAHDIEVEKNWLTEAMKSMQTLPNATGLVAFNQEGGLRHAYHGLIAREFCNKFLKGNIFYPEYIHFWCDLELTAVAKKLNRFSFSFASKVSHNLVEDAMRKEALEKSYIQGKELLAKRQSMGFPYGLRLSDISMVTVHYHPLNIIQKNLFSYLPEEIDFIKIDNEGNKEFSSAAKALNYGIRKTKNDIVMCVHEDMRFTKDWFDAFIEQEEQLKNWGVLGIVGMIGNKTYVGHGYNTPLEAETLDECCIIVNKRNNIWFDAETFRDWHCYGVDFCLQARHKGLKVYIIGGKAYHDDSWKPHSKLILPQQARNLIRQKWGKIFETIHTTTGIC